MDPHVIFFEKLFSLLGRTITQVITPQYKQLIIFEALTVNSVITISSEHFFVYVNLTSHPSFELLVKVIDHDGPNLEWDIFKSADDPTYINDRSPLDNSVSIELYETSVDVNAFVAFNFCGPDYKEFLQCIQIT